MIQRFHLERDLDVTGVSGSGLVAEGCVFSDGTVAIRWRGDRPSTVVWARIEDAYHVHGHGGATRFVFLDRVVLCGAQHQGPTEVWTCNVEAGHDGPHADGLHDSVEWTSGAAGFFAGDDLALGITEDEPQRTT